MLAGVGVSWYTWLEQGRQIGVTTAVLDAVSRALLLDDAERSHLYSLAGHNPPRPGPAEQAPAVLYAIVDRWSPDPAYVCDRHWDVLASNAAARELLGPLLTSGNAMQAYFGGDSLRSRLTNPDECARSLVAGFRANAARYPDDPEFQRIADDLTARSPEFAALWNRHEVGGETEQASKEFRDSTGERRYSLATLEPADQPGLRLVLLAPT